MVVKQLKAKGTDIARVRGVCAAIGADNFSLIVDSLADSGRSLLVKIDKYNPDVKSSDSPWLRKHLNELAQGSMEPVDRPPRNTKSTKKQISGSAQKRKPSTKRAISIKAFETKWDGKSRDD
jgi:hypothetical protein